MTLPTILAASFAFAFGMKVGDMFVHMTLGALTRIAREIAARRGMLGTTSRCAACMGPMNSVLCPTCVMLTGEAPHGSE